LVNGLQNDAVKQSMGGGFDTAKIQAITEELE